MEIGKGHRPCSHYLEEITTLEVVTEIPDQNEGGLHCRLCGGTWPWRLVAEKLHVQKVGR